MENVAIPIWNFCIGKFAMINYYALKIRVLYDQIRANS